MNPNGGPQLRDIHLPPDPGWWPPAPGWWIAAAILVMFIAFAILTLRRARKKRRHRRAILAELDRCIGDAHDDPAVLAAALSLFLRRIALAQQPAAVAWQGERWLEYLDKRSGGAEFRSGIGRVLNEAPYRANVDYDTAALIALVRRWTHRTLDAGVACA
ncbi:MAG: DUF4381 domain-containing protein [Rudaea sp.]